MLESEKNDEKKTCFEGFAVDCCGVHIITYTIAISPLKMSMFSLFFVRSLLYNWIKYTTFHWVGFFFSKGCSFAKENFDLVIPSAQFLDWVWYYDIYIYMQIFTIFIIYIIIFILFNFLIKKMALFDKKTKDIYIYISNTFFYLQWNLVYIFIYIIFNWIEKEKLHHCTTGLFQKGLLVLSHQVHGTLTNYKGFPL